LVELEGIDANLGQVVNDVPDVAAGVHQHGHAVLVRGATEALEERLEELAPLGRAHQQSVLDAPVLAEGEALGAGFTHADDHLLQERSHPLVQ